MSIMINGLSSSDYQMNYKRTRDDGLFYIYLGIIARCRYKYNNAYQKWYGGVGIKMLWNSYLDFKKDMYDSYIEHLEKYGKKNTSIDRIDSSGHYCRENCRWATIEMQAKNRRPRKPSIVFNGESIKQAGARLGVSRYRMWQRIRDGWSVEKAFTTPNKML